ncbi:MAG: biopolymer transporter ExbD, partial [Pseudomonadota bacterium]
PPNSSSDEQMEGDTQLLLIGAEGQFALAGRVVGIDEVAAHVAAHVATLSEPRVVRIKADGRVPAETVIAVLKRLRAAGADEVKLLTIHNPSRTPSHKSLRGE